MPIANYINGINKRYDNRTLQNPMQYFDKIPEIAWNFYIGGCQLMQKGLKKREDKELSFDDVKHYAKIINALYLTNHPMQKKLTR